MTAREDRFFGVEYDVDTDADEKDDDVIEVIEADDDLKVEVLDDRPPEDRRPPRDESVDDDDDDDDDDEVEQYSGRVKKRISKLRYEWHEERRAKEAALREAEAAIEFAKTLTSRYKHLNDLVKKTSGALGSEATERAKRDLIIAQRAVRDAYESGDADKMAEAQNKLTEAQVAMTQVANVPQTVIRQWQQETQEAEAKKPKPQPQTQQQPTVPEPDPLAKKWAQNNEWFGKDPEMTSLAYGIHEKLVKDGVDPTSNDYYRKLDARLRQVFPDRFDSSTDDAPNTSSAETEVAVPPRRGGKPVVAPAGRNNGSRPRTVRLTQSQVKVANALGVPLEQYARELLKEQANG